MIGNSIAFFHASASHPTRPRPSQLSCVWQPIETAPKDGTEITGGWAGTKPFTSSGTPIVWQNTPRRSGWFALSPTYENDNGEFFSGKWVSKYDLPTHWMPVLIDPPLRKAGMTNVTQATMKEILEQAEDLGFIGGSRLRVKDLARTLQEFAVALRHTSSCRFTSTNTCSFTSCPECLKAAALCEEFFK